MRIRLGFIIGFAVGYYLGTMAGKERYIQLNRLIGRAAHSDAAHSATDKAKDIIDIGYGRAKDEIAHHIHHNGTGQPDVIIPS